MKRKAHQSLSFAAAVLGASLAGTAVAHAAGAADLNAGAQVDFISVDRDTDGKISKAEASTHKELSKQFDQLDADKDGKLNEGEFAKFEVKGSAAQPKS